ncbi:MAG: enoyl-CoA hydratase/isomerase family protein [Anaerolineae bacterium]|nr:enoyl-CoA hydratase/isomerase family protein [Anaerolineae bacterium]
MSDILLVDRHEAVTVLTINRPEVRNALDAAVVDRMQEALAACETDGTRCIVITGAGGAFSSGADLRQAVGSTPDDVYRILTDHYAPTLKAIRSASWPVIAAVDGYAAGIGCDMACACDMRLVSARGKFAELFIRIGLVPDGGGTYLLPRLVGLGRAMEMMFSGRDVEAEEALRIGLANQVLPVEDFMGRVLNFADEISRKSPHALRRGKAAMLAALDSSYSDAMAREAGHQREILMSEDGTEGFLAFIEKRPPVWSGR